MVDIARRQHHRTGIGHEVRLDGERHRAIRAHRIPRPRHDLWRSRDHSSVPRSSAATSRNGLTRKPVMFSRGQASGTVSRCPFYGARRCGTVAQRETVLERVPRPSGEGGATRRVRALATKCFGIPALTRPSGTLSRRERDLASRVIAFGQHALASGISGFVERARRLSMSS